VADDTSDFNASRLQQIKTMLEDSAFQKLSNSWIEESSRLSYSYHFDWLGLPIIQFPQDIVAVQELVWNVKPDLIIETGVARGGSLLLSASLLALLDVCDGLNEAGNTKRQVLGIDIDIRPHNRIRIENHPLARYVQLFEGSSVDEEVLRNVKAVVDKHERVMVFLDSNHTTEHVSLELAAYSDFVSPGSYLVVFDTVVNAMPKDLFKDRPWGPDNNPMIAVRDFLAARDDFEVDHQIDGKLGISVAPNGYLRKRR